MRDELIWLRYAFVGLALALAAIAVPAAVAESLRAAAGPDASPALLHVEAELGWLRGDLWGAYALAGAARPDADKAAAREAFRSAAQGALALAPYQPRLWLRLAENERENSDATTHFDAVLKMAYDTAPADDPGMADRLEMALSGIGAPDEELDEFARGDVRAMIGHDRLNQLSTVYARLGGGGRRFIERAVEATRPELVPRLATPE